jgi:chromosomal replication initiator protein
MTLVRGSGSALLDQIVAERMARRKIWSQPVVKKSTYKQPLQETDITAFGPAKVAEILHIVALYFGISERDICSNRRFKEIVFARHVTFYLCRHLTLNSLPEIGRRLHGRDHTTVMHGVNGMEGLIKTDEKLAADIATLTEMLEFE